MASPEKPWPIRSQPSANNGWDPKPGPCRGKICKPSRELSACNWVLAGDPSSLRFAGSFETNEFRRPPYKPFVTLLVSLMKLSILMPVYNERTVEDRSISLVLHAPLPENMERELVIVDDCCTDGT